MKLHRIGLILLTLVILVTSYAFSSQTAVESLTVSDRVLVQLRLVSQEEVVNKIGNYNDYSKLMREVAHVVIFILITLCLYLMFFVWTKRNWLSVLLTLALVISYAYFDECHQRSIDGRSYQWLDLVLDFIGCTLSLLVASMVTILNRVMMKMQERR